MSCIFCSDVVRNGTVMENELAFAVYDKFPQTQGHMLIIPKRCTKNWFETTPAERDAIDALLFLAKELLDHEHKPDGYNILTNCGAEAGQSVFHTHVHLIPRYKGGKKIFDWS